jgi:hypothetical protein
MHFSFLSSSAFSQPWSSALAYRPKPYLSSFRAVRVASVRPHSSNEPFVSQPLSCRAIYEAFEAPQGVPLHIALIEPESELVHVASEVLVADVVEGAVDA